MLVERGGLVATLGKGTHHRPRDLSAPVGAAAGGLVPPNDEEPVLLELRTLDQRVDVGLQPCIGGAQGTVMGVVAEIRRDEGEVRQRPIRQIGSELRKGHHLRRLRRVVADVREITHRHMVRVV